MKIVDLKYKATNNMKVNNIMKVFGSIKFKRFLNILGILMIPKY